jgi:hypothetical protein
MVRAQICKKLMFVEELKHWEEEEQKDQALLVTSSRTRSLSRTDRLRQRARSNTPSPVPALDLVRSDSLRMERATEYKNKILNRLHQEEIYSSDDEQVQVCLLLCTTFAYFLDCYG